MANYKEIVTKAVIAKGKKLFTSNHELMVNNKPSTILGVWVINHTFNGIKNNNEIRILLSDSESCIKYNILFLKYN